jgi:hypothetical protein
MAKPNSVPKPKVVPKPSAKAQNAKKTSGGPAKKRSSRLAFEQNLQQ